MQEMDLRYITIQNKKTEENHYERKSKNYYRWRKGRSLY